MPDDLADAWRALRDRLVAADLLVPMGVDGLYGRTGTLDAVVDGLDRLARRLGVDDQPRSLQFPPVIPRTAFHRSGYLRNFPQLIGPVFTFEGDERAHAEVLARVERGEDYADLLVPSDVVMTPACCYPVYPSLAGVLEATVVVETRNHCYRHEPSPDPMRMQVFEMREHVCVGEPSEVQAWRERWVDRGLAFFHTLGLDARADDANDPFFGRAGRLLARSQRALSLKVEFLVDAYGLGVPTACGSLNHHQEHFGELFDIHIAGDHAHSACIGFGLDRCAIALVARYGDTPSTWPAGVRSELFA